MTRQTDKKSGTKDQSSILQSIPRTWLISSFSFFYCFVIAIELSVSFILTILYVYFFDGNCCSRPFCLPILPPSLCSVSDIIQKSFPVPHFFSQFPVCFPAQDMFLYSLVSSTHCSLWSWLSSPNYSTLLEKHIKELNNFLRTWSSYQEIAMSFSIT